VHLKNIQTKWNYFKKHKTLNLKTIPEMLNKWQLKKPEIFRKDNKKRNIKNNNYCSQLCET
jgi:hypothetical protein